MVVFFYNYNKFIKACLIFFIFVNNCVKGEKMKKYIIIIICVIIAVVMLASGFKTETKYEYLRVHIRANSNTEIDQGIKYQIKDKVVDFLTPLLANATDKTKAKQIVMQNQQNICKIADDLLKDNGFEKFIRELTDQYEEEKTNEILEDVTSMELPMDWTNIYLNDES